MSTSGIAWTRRRLFFARHFWLARVQWRSRDARFVLWQWAVTAMLFGAAGASITLPWSPLIVAGAYTLMYWTLVEIKVRRDNR